MKILLIEDDDYTSELLSEILSAHHYAVDTIADGAAGLEMAARWDYDLILLDIMLPTLDGIEVCRRLRACGCRTSVLMLTAKDANEDVIAGLDAGADDYVAKSCDSSQLLARVRALLRRGGNASSSPVLTWGLLCFDPASAHVTYNQEEVPLRPKEYSLLELFLRHPQRVFSRSTIIEHLWAIEETPVEGSVTNLIKDLRQRLKSAGMVDDCIETVYGLGYRLKAAPEDQQMQDKTVRRGDADRMALESVLVGSWEDDQNFEEHPGRIAIQRIAERFQISLEQRMAALEALERSFQSGNFSLRYQQAARIQAHKLAGGLGTFGYGKASEIAESIECLLQPQVKQKPQLANRFSQLLAKLKQELASPQSEPSIAKSSTARR